MPDKNVLPTSLIETVAGFTAGVISTLCLHPLDLIKTRLQVDQHSPQIGGSLRLVGEICRNEGGIIALYRGLTPNLLGNSTGWGLYFLCYGRTKDLIRNARNSEQVELGPSEYFAASGTAGILTAVLTNPIWVIKTRMLSTGSNIPGAYPSFTSGVQQILKFEGVSGFYRGLLPSLFGVGHGAFQFMAYEQLKLHWSGSAFSSLRTTPTDRDFKKLSNFDLIVISTLSKLFAGFITYPYQVLRTQLQRYDATHVYRGAVDASVRIWREEGFSGFYKGLGPNMLRVLPSTWVTFLVYENVKIFLPQITISDD